MTKSSAPSELDKRYRGRAIVAGLVAGIGAGIIAYYILGPVGAVVGFIAGAVAGANTTLITSRAREDEEKT